MSTSAPPTRRRTPLPGASAGEHAEAGARALAPAPAAPIIGIGGTAHHALAAVPADISACAIAPAPGVR
ncbi:hypothetical protein ABZ916_20910 [Streptomyces sp. NPDC046853]|uniref:hypothetical protein n=1 Tax=Streptomyces sp. NPDC046853 TaxID=3154920 RepID=UPI00340BE1A9